MHIIEEFFKKNNFDIPRMFLEEPIGTKFVKYQLKKDYLFDFVKKMTILKGEISKNFFKPENFEIDKL